LSVLLPRTNGNHRADNATFANKKNAGRCPSCNSAIHSIQEGEKNWRCEDFLPNGEPCNTVYAAPRKRKEVF
jgi:hypothetical protein